MINTIEISKYKSVDHLEIPLGRVNVFIGENGAGKSNILEAIALAGAASAKKLDNEFLTSRGIRVTPPEYMRTAFPGFSSSNPIQISAIAQDQQTAEFELTNDNAPYSKWECQISRHAKVNYDFNQFFGAFDEFVKMAKKDGAEGEARTKQAITVISRLLSESVSDTGKKTSLGKKNKAITFTLDDDNAFGKYIAENRLRDAEASRLLSNFIIYSPENSALRTFQKEGQIEPLGINGEGLLRLLTVIAGDDRNKSLLEEIRSSLKVLGWFQSLEIVSDTSASKSRIEIQDRYLEDTKRYFDQMSANEGFLFLLFYFTLFSSDLTPKFFAIDNIDASLNPKLCEKLTKVLVSLAKKHGKQVVLTTHNPAILDGLNLGDDDQRLFVVSRNRIGCTRVKRVQKQSSSDNNRPVRLSEAFLRGTLGGVPRGF